MCSLISPSWSLLADLAEAGVVRRERHPPIHLYALNDLHVAHGAVLELAGLRDELRRVRAYLEAWDSDAPAATWLFGSAARGEGSVRSDVDVLVLRPETLDEDNPVWVAPVADLSSFISLLSGNSCEILELPEEELGHLVLTDTTW